MQPELCKAARTSGGRCKVGKERVVLVLSPHMSSDLVESGECRRAALASMHCGVLGRRQDIIIITWPTRLLLSSGALAFVDPAPHLSRKGGAVLYVTHGTVDAMTGHGVANNSHLKACCASASQEDSVRLASSRNASSSASWFWAPMARRCSNCKR